MEGRKAGNTGTFKIDSRGIYRTMVEKPKTQKVQEQHTHKIRPLVRDEKGDCHP